MEKPIVKLPQGQTVNHPSGKLEKQITRADLERNWKTYIYTHAHLYENADRLKRQISMQSSGYKQGTSANFAKTNISGQSTIVAFVSERKVAGTANQMSAILSLATKDKKEALASQEQKPTDHKNKKK